MFSRHRDHPTFTEETDVPEGESVETVDGPKDNDGRAVIKSFRYTFDSCFNARFLPPILLIVGICVLNYLLTIRLDAIADWMHNPALDRFANWLLEHGGMDGGFFHGQFWKPLTSAFFHGGIVHLGSNMLGLLSLAYLYRLYAPRYRWLIVLFSTQILGCIITAYFDPRLSVGISVGIMGLIGAQLAALIRQRHFRRNEQPAVYGITIGTIVTMMGMQIVVESLIPHVGHLAHACGFTLGLIIGSFISLRGTTAIYALGDKVRVRSIAYQSKAPYGALFCTIDVLEGFDKEHHAVYSVEKLHTWSGGHVAHYRRLWGSRRMVRLHRGLGRKLIDRFTVPSWKDPELAHKLWVEQIKKQAAAEQLPAMQRLAVNAIALVPTAALWWYMFQQFAGDMRMDPATFDWINRFAPAVVAPYLITTLSYAGCAMMTFFFAQLLHTIFRGIIVGFLGRFLGKKTPATA